jgi:hypothetical protein
MISSVLQLALFSVQAVYKMIMHAPARIHTKLFMLALSRRSGKSYKTCAVGEIRSAIRQDTN